MIINYYILNYIPFLRFICLIIFISQRRFILICLLCLECIILRVIFLIIVIVRLKDLYLLIIILAIAACEARIGLAIVVIITRFIGNDKIYILKFFKC